jgi:Ca2+-binding RTX toxin-like protein
MSVQRHRQVVELLECRRLLSLTPLGTETVVPGVLGSVRTKRGMDLAVADDGSFIVAADVQRGGINQVTVFRYTAAGEASGKPVVLYSYVPPIHLGQRRTAGISASIDRFGNAVVAYGLHDGDDSGVYFNLLSWFGRVAPTVRVDGIDHRDLWPDVSMDAGGGFFLAWPEPGDSDSAGPILARAFDRDGEPRAEAFTLAEASRDPQAPFSFIGLQIAAHRDGTGAAFAVTRVFDDTSHESITFGQTTRSAVAAGTTGEIGGSTGESLFASSVAALSDGSFVVGYGRSDDEDRAFIQRVTSDGAPNGEPIQIGASLASTGDDVHRVSVDGGPDGGFVATVALTTRDVDTISAAQFDAAGQVHGGYVPLASDVAVDPDVGDARFVPKISADPTGAPVVAYVMRSDDTIRFRRLSADSTQLSVHGTGDNDHIIVERVRERLYVNVNGNVQRYNVADVQFLAINGFGGDDDIINATALPSKIIGGHGADTLWGGTGPDVLLGYNGENHLHGGDGGDTLYGDGANDLLHGGDGRDLLDGQGGEDTLIGASGNDVMRGDFGSDRLFGDSGNDTIDGGFAPDYVDGGAGDDSLSAGSGFEGGDSLFAQDGNDFLFDGHGSQTLHGGSGNDRVIIVDGDNDVLEIETITPLEDWWNETRGIA